MEFICDNEKGERIKFGNMAPFWLVSVNGLGSDFNVYTSKNSGQDGENYNGSDAQKRNIVLTLELSLRDYEEQMKKLYHFFPKDKSGTLICCGSELRKIRYYVEKVEPESETFLPAGSSPYETKNVTVSLVCPDPKFYAFDDQLTQLAVWKGGIRFPLCIKNPFKTTCKINTLIGNVQNDSTVEMGLTVTFRASGTVVNPSLYDVNRQLLMKIHKTMGSGDVIVITTGDGNKRVKLISGGVSTNINNLMQYPPKWLKACPGDNLLRYNADSGIDNLSVSILSTQAYWGV